MTRELKFRVWTGKEYLDDFNLDRMSCKFNGELSVEGYSDAIIEQFTGLRDKNGRNIYEGDVVSAKYTHYSTQVEARTLPKSIDVREKDFIAFDENLAAFTLGGTSLCSFDSETEFEIIGNIHENGDLLK